MQGRPLKAGERGEKIGFIFYKMILSIMENKVGEAGTGKIRTKTRVSKFTAALSTRAIR